MFGNASQESEQADQLYFGMLGILIAFLWSVAEYLHSMLDVKRSEGSPPNFADSSECNRSQAPHLYASRLANYSKPM